MIVGRVPYLNCEPFHLHLDALGFPMVEAPPRMLGEMAADGRVDSGLMAAADFHRLSDDFELAGPFCIAARRQVWSVLLLSQRPPRALHGSTVVLTEESSTSAALLRLLLTQAFGVRAPEFVRASADSDLARSADARLVIGDEALRLRAAGFPDSPYITDLAREWWEWTGTPMVFAVWAVRKNAPAAEKAALREALTRSLAEYPQHVEAIAARRAPGLGMTPEEIAAYLKILTYRMGPLEEQGLATYRSRLETLDVAGHALALGR